MRGVIDSRVVVFLYGAIISINNMRVMERTLNFSCEPGEEPIRFASR